MMLYRRFILKNAALLRVWKRLVFWALLTLRAWTRYFSNLCWKEQALCRNLQWVHKIHEESCLSLLLTDVFPVQKCIWFFISYQRVMLDETYARGVFKFILVLRNDIDKHQKARALWEMSVKEKKKRCSKTVSSGDGLVFKNGPETEHLVCWKTFGVGLGWFQENSHGLPNLWPHLKRLG